jgi:hypothetical protein
MLEFSQWIGRQELPSKPWLIVGQGPTFARHSKVDLAGYSVLGFDQVARELRVDVAHALDVETIAPCADRVEKNCRWLLLPRRPEVNRKPGPPVEAYFGRMPVLRRMAAQNRLVWYNRATASPQAGDATQATTPPGALADIAELFAQIGVRRLRSLGLDGGHAHSQEFRELEVQALRNSPPTQRDVPPREIEAVFYAHGIDYAPLAEPMRIFLGVNEALRVPARVLEFSLRKHASEPVVVDYLLGVTLPKLRHWRQRFRSASALRRFAIPELCGYRGRALYLDARGLALADVAELWAIPFGRQRVLCAYRAAGHATVHGVGEECWAQPGRQASVMMLDCARLRWDIAEIARGLDEGRYSQQALLDELCLVHPDEVADTLPPEWCCPQDYEAGRSKLVQFTVQPTYPWKSGTNAANAWLDCYREAVAAGAVPAQEVVLGVASGHLQQELLAGFDGPDAQQIAGLCLDLPQRLKLLASHRAKKVFGHARRLAGQAMRGMRSKT